MFGGSEEEDGLISGAALLRDGGKRHAEESLGHDAAQSKRSRRLPDAGDGQPGGQHAPRKPELDCEGAMRSSMHPDFGIAHDKLSSPQLGVDGECEAEDRLRRGYSAAEDCEKEEAEEEDMEDDEQDDDGGIGDIEEVVTGDDDDGDGAGVLTPGGEATEDDAADVKLAAEKEMGCIGHRDHEGKEVRDDERDEPAAVASAGAEGEEVNKVGVGMEDRLTEKELHQDAIDKKYDMEATSTMPTLTVQAMPVGSHMHLPSGHRAHEKKDIGFVEHKMVELQNGFPKLDEIHAPTSKHFHIHHLQQHHHPSPQMHVAKGPTATTLWGAPVAAPGAGPSFASMLASTNTFAAMLQTGLSPPANQQPISIKLAGTNAFSAVLAAGTFSAVLAQGQDSKDKGRLAACGEKEDCLRHNMDGEYGEHKVGIESKHKTQGHDDHDEDQQPLQAHGHVTEVGDSADEHPSQDHVRVDGQMEQQGEPSHIDADGHVMGHGDGQVEAPSEGPDGGADDGHHHHHGNSQVDGPGVGPDDYRTLSAHGEVQHAGDVEDARRHDADLSPYAQGEHSSSGHIDPADHKVRFIICASVFCTAPHLYQCILPFVSLQMQADGGRDCP